ncbi:MAG: DNA-deoxyinosine glycosylase [Nitrospirota bacterium]
MTQIRCFDPIEDAKARVLILGSMPGKESLKRGQYYAHPRNLFWPILGELVGTKPALSYEERICVLQSAKIALWDVLALCTRPTSLDSDIEKDSLVCNDFASFFSRHKKITSVFFNGAKAQECYLRHGLPGLDTYTTWP